MIYHGFPGRWVRQFLLSLAIFCLAGAARGDDLSRFFLDDCFLQGLDNAAPSVAPNPTGAVSGNTAGDRLALESQAGGVTWIRRGLMRQRPDWTATGWRILDWGLSQDPSRSVDATHQTTRFLTSVALAMTIDPAGATAERKRVFRERLAWLMSDEALARASRVNRQFTHRAWMRAALFQLSSTILADPGLQRLAAANVRQAIDQQTSEGAYQERGGFDVGYHAFGMTFEIIWLVAAGHRDVLYQEALASFLKGLDWYRQRLNDDGTVDRSGSTRMLRERNGTKDIRYGRAIEVFLGAALVTGDRRWLEIASSLHRGGIAEGRLPTSSPSRLNSRGVGVNEGLVTACASF